MQTLKKVVCPYALTIPTPAALIRLILGEKSALVLDDTHVSNKKLMRLGFEFEYPTLQVALKNIYGK
jgi:NAD dependent epimerase/dehydratase family enzyme